MTADDSTDDRDAASAEDLAELADLQRRLREKPDSEVARQDLLLAYGRPCFHSEPERIALLMWYVRNRPDEILMRSPCAYIDHVRYPKLYAQVKAAWEEELQREPNRVDLVRGAAPFVAYADPERARDLLQAAISANPEIGDLWLDLSGLAEEPRERLRLLEQARSLGAKQPNLLRWLCDAALAADDLAKGAEYGRELLAESHEVEPLSLATGLGVRDGRAALPELRKPSGQRAYARHHGHTTLGAVALRSGDIVAALDHLRASAEVDTDARLASYGPSFELANELAQRGFFAEVHAYLKACQTFWREAVLDEWCAELREGRAPSFE